MRVRKNLFVSIGIFGVLFAGCSSNSGAGSSDPAVNPDTAAEPESTANLETATDPNTAVSPEPSPPELTDTEPVESAMAPAPPATEPVDPDPPATDPVDPEPPVTEPVDPEPPVTEPVEPEPEPEPEPETVNPVPADPDMEPQLVGAGAIKLIQDSTLEGWDVPSDLWSIENGTLVGDTKGQELSAPEWAYCEQAFSDFAFTVEARLTGNGPNSGIYFRASKVLWRNRYEAAVGYEYDIAEGDLNGSIGDYFARPRFRVSANAALIDRTYKMDDWNRLTLRARGNRVEYWMNGIKIQDYVDSDPTGSKEGVIGLQLHNAIVMKAEFRNAYVVPID